MSAKKMGKTTKIKQPAAMEDDTSTFTMKDIQSLGGTKMDFEMLKDLDDLSEVVVCQPDMDDDPVNREDIRMFMETIGLADLRRQRKIKEAEAEEEKKLLNKKKIKLAVAPEIPEQTKPAAGKDDATKKKKKKKVEVQDSEVTSTTVVPTKTPSLSFLHELRSKKELLIKPGGSWSSTEFPNDPVTFEPATEEQVKKIQQYAAHLLEQEVELYTQQKDRQRGSAMAWMKQVLTSGTLPDKIAALTLLSQEAPIHNLASLDSLVAMVKKKGRREALLSLDAVKDLFLSELLLDRKLKTFDQHPVHLVEELASGDKTSRDRRLLLWYFEAQLKERYSSFISAIQILLQDTVAGPKKKALSVVHELLSSKSEQEKLLLTLLVNKLGDPDYKVASCASTLLTRLVATHPNMKSVVVLEVERLLYRPNIAAKAQKNLNEEITCQTEMIKAAPVLWYYAICFLNQLLLGHKDTQLAARLIAVYFSFFKAFVKRGEVDSKMMSALLTGVNRAYPFAKFERDKIIEQIDTLYKIVHIVNFFTGIQALTLLHQVTEASEKTAERYYMALYRKLVDPGLKTSARPAMFLNLLFKSMKADTSIRRIQAFVKRLLQVCCQLPVPFICAAMYLLSELQTLKPGLLKTTKVAEDADDEEEHFADAPEEEEEEKGEAGEIAEEVKVVLKDKGSPTVSSWVHKDNLTGHRENFDYDAQARNPEYCHADMECVWELKRLGQHFHPTVVLWADKLVKSEKIEYEGDPLQDFTLIRFLDRFVYRNPKKQHKDGEQRAVMGRSRSGHQPIAAVNSEEYLGLGEDSIPADEKFFYRYFSKTAAKKDKLEEDRESEGSAVSDTEFDEYLDTFEMGLTEDRKDDLDFARDLQKQKGSKKKKKEEDSEDDSDLDDDLSDEEVDFGDDLEDDFDMEDDLDMGDDAAFDEEDVEFSDSDVGEVVSKQLKKGKRVRQDEDDDDLPEELMPREKRVKGDTADLFAAADQFAELMEENIGTASQTSGSNAIINKDKSDAKQLKWEMKREHWMNDKGRRKPKKQQSFGKKGKGPMNKRKGRK